MSRSHSLKDSRGILIKSSQHSEGFVICDRSFCSQIQFLQPLLMAWAIDIVS
ncbi:hypothetical protein AM1_1338 [Acaryochloris marina MBIC11017]|uniref:Uncharacterized protein n=1 Tax=Acaryochloris marina (strain MBIC 11017) TaxID=329726 RepID=B0C6F1_ACAM1|nr:hypothetical protein AM1_1338 [Acaryochloris marina MBIC11017]